VTLPTVQLLDRLGPDSAKALTGIAERLLASGDRR
jgi:hypothetical protein